MAILEQGVGVGFRPAWQNSVMVSTPGGQPGGILTGNLFGSAGSYWFPVAYQPTARTLRVSVLPRLWTGPTDPTDPGYTYGVHWMLGLVLSTEGSAGICQGAFIGATVIERGANIADGRTRPSPTLITPLPGVPELISLQPPSTTTFLTLAIILASGLTQTVCAAVDLSVGETWTG